MTTAPRKVGFNACQRIWPSPYLCMPVLHCRNHGHKIHRRSVEPGWPGRANIRQLCDCLLWAVFLSYWNTTKPKSSGHFFQGKRYVVILKIVWLFFPRLNLCIKLDMKRVCLNFGPFLSQIHLVTLNGMGRLFTKAVQARTSQPFGFPF
jgi:hypothetical protein